MALDSTEIITLQKDPPPAGSQPAGLIVARSHGRTDVGRVRKSNEDQFVIAEMARTMLVHQTSLSQPHMQHGHHRAHIFLVADGMGGHNAGEVASAMTVATMEGFILNILRRFSNLRPTEEETVVQELETALHQAHARLIAETQQHPEFAGMGTTFTMAFTSNWKLFVLHVGDSRCYLFRNRELKQLTTDHTVVAELVRRGLLEPAQAANHMYRHVVTNVVGGKCPAIQPEVQRIDLQPADVILLCTDGLTDMITNDRIRAILHGEPDPQKACERLIKEANDQGGRDNVTAIVARLEAARDG